jgi:hypothetical protein
MREQERRARLTMRVWRPVVPQCVGAPERLSWLRRFMGLALMVVAMLGASAAAAPVHAVDTLEGAVTNLDIQAGDIVHDSVRDVIYASVRSVDVQYAGSVLALDPTTTAVIGRVNVGGDPVPLALSDDAQYLYVGLADQPKVFRINLDSFAVDLEIPLPLEFGIATFEAAAYEIDVMPGVPETIAVSGTVIDGNGATGIAIFDGASMRPLKAKETVYDESIEFSAADTVYSTCARGCTFKTLNVYAVDADGVTFVESFTEIAEGEIDAHTTSKLYSSFGRVVDISGTPAADERLLIDGHALNTLGYAAGTRSVWGSAYTSPNQVIVLEEFDAESYEPINSLSLWDSRFGEDGLYALKELIVLPGPRFVAIAEPKCCYASRRVLVVIDVVAEISGTTTDRHTGDRIGGICVAAFQTGVDADPVAETVTSSSGEFALQVPLGTYDVAYIDCEGWDYGAEWYGTDTETFPVTVGGAGADASMALTTTSMTGLVDMSQGFWAMSAPRTDLVDGFFFGNPGDFPILGDWDCDGVDTPGMYRQSDGYVYLRNSNTQGIADIRFFFGDPDDIPLAGDFNGDGCDTVSIFRPSAARVFIINELGQNDGGLGAAEFTYLFGNPGDKPFVGDFDLDFIDTVGLHRESTGLVYFRNSHTQGNADVQYIFGDPGDRLVAGNFSGFWEETTAVFRPSDLTFYIRHTNTQGNADRTETWDFTSTTWYPVAGVFGLSGADLTAQSFRGNLERNTS